VRKGDEKRVKIHLLWCEAIEQQIPKVKQYNIQVNKTVVRLTILFNEQNLLFDVFHSLDHCVFVGDLQQRQNGNQTSLAQIVPVVVRNRHTISCRGLHKSHPLSVIFKPWGSHN
jgi:hypothetical protein